MFIADLSTPSLHSTLLQYMIIPLQLLTCIPTNDVSRLILLIIAIYPQARLRPRDTSQQPKNPFLMADGNHEPVFCV